MTKLSVVIPAYNEEQGIADIVERVVAVESRLRDVGVAELELLVVDDGSSDQTASIVSTLAASHPQLRLIRHQRNGGYGAALKTGFGQACGDLIGFLDADGTYPPEHFPLLCEAALQGWELVIGSRMAGANSQMPATRRLGNIFFARLLSLMGQQRVTDSASGMRVFQRAILQRLSPLPDGLNLTPVMSTRAIHENVTILELPIPYSERVGASKLSVVRDGTLFLSSMLWTVMKYNPVRILGMLGLSGILLGLTVALWLGLSRLSGVTDLGPWGVGLLFVGAIAGFAGVSLLTLGTTFNYLVALFHKTPMRQGLFRQSRIPNLGPHFHKLGILCICTGLAIGLAAMVLGLSGWDISRLWLYMLGSAMSTLIGIQLLVSWTLLRVLAELNQREERIALDETQIAVVGSSN